MVRLIARHITIRYSAKDGVQFNVSAGGSILNSQIISNSQIVTTTYGVNNSCFGEWGVGHQRLVGRSQRAAVGCKRMQHGPGR